jgi:hypothetical protein
MLRGLYTSEAPNLPIRFVEHSRILNVVQPDPRALYLSNISRGNSEVVPSRSSYWSIRVYRIEIVHPLLAYHS